MKKKYLLISLQLLVSVFMSSSTLEIDGVKLKEFPAQSILWKTLHLSSSEELGEIVILPNSSFNQAEVIPIILRLDKLPTSMLEKINRNGVVIKLFTGKLTENPTVAHLKGIIPRGYTKKTWDNVPGVGGSKTVLVKIGASSKGNGHGSVNLELHELAHSIDRHIYHNIRFKQNFLDIWNEEKELLFPGQSYFINYPEEYFAESFAYYYLGDNYRDLLKQKAPKTFQFIKNLS